jgi:CNP1-like family
LRAVLLACLLALLGACGGDRASTKSDWERKNEGRLVKEGAEPEPDLPAYPQRQNLIEFSVSSASDFKFFIDRTSISVRDRIVRYVLVARSPNGVDNVSYEGMNCPAGEYQVYATGRSDGTWLSRPGTWREIPPRSVQRWHNTLQKEYFCLSSVTDAAEAVKTLERAGAWSPGPQPSVGR